MSLTKIDKETFLDKIYELTNQAKDEFQRYANMDMESAGTILFVENAITNAQTFLQNYQCRIVGETTNPDTTTYFLNDEGTPGFCPSSQYESICKAQEPPQDLGCDSEECIDKDFHTDEDESSKIIYG